MKTKNRFGFRCRKISGNQLLAIIGFVMILFVNSEANASQASLVQIIETSRFSTPSPDPAGIVYLNTSGTFLISDSEVNEMYIFTGENLFEMTADGFLIDDLTTVSFSSEPTGVAFNPVNGHLFFSDDDQMEVFEVDLGPDGLYNTSDDIVTSFDTTVFHSFDPEGITFDTWDGVLFIVDGIGSKVYRIDPGVNGKFDGAPPISDDQITAFDTAILGVRDPEGIAFNPDNGSLFIVGEPINVIAEVSVDGELVRMIDISAAPVVMPAGLAFAPSSVNPSESNLFVADRGVDNDANPNENDGRIFEVTIPPYDTTAPVWNGATTGIGSAMDGAGGTVRVEFDTAIDDEDLTNVRFNIYYAETAVWDDVNWSNNTVLLNVTPSAGSSYAHAFTVTGMATDIEYIFGVRVADQSLNEDGNTNTLTVIPKGSDVWTERTYNPAADTSVVSSSPNQNYGSQSFVEVDGSPVKIAYLRFDVSGLSGTVASAFIRLRCTDPSPFGGTIYTISNDSWQETTVTYNNRPAIDGTALDSLESVSVGDVVELDITAAISGDGIYNFAINSNNTNGANYSSRESSNPPVLIITTSNEESNTAPQIDSGPTATPASILADESAQLSVQASDADGDVLSYSWTVLAGEGSVTGSGATVTYVPPAVTAQQVFAVSVTVSDGNGGSDSGTVNVMVNPAAPNAAPTVSISAPTDGASFTQGDAISFSGSSTDAEDGDLTAGLSWSSSIDGAIGAGGSFSRSDLSVGTHTITATVTDSGGANNSAQVSVTVTANAAPPEAPTNLAAFGSRFVDLSWNDNSNNEDGFEIYRCESIGCSDFSFIVTTEPNATSYKDRSVEKKTTYKYKIRAVNQFGSSPFSNESEATTK